MNIRLENIGVLAHQNVLKEYRTQENRHSIFGGRSSTAGPQGDYSMISRLSKIEDSSRLGDSYMPGYRKAPLPVIPNATESRRRSAGLINGEE